MTRKLQRHNGYNLPAIYQQRQAKKELTWTLLVLYRLLNPEKEINVYSYSQRESDEMVMFCLRKFTDFEGKSKEELLVIRRELELRIPSLNIEN